jgi:membrane dipeptidase
MNRRQFIGTIAAGTIAGTQFTLGQVVGAARSTRAAAASQANASPSQMLALDAMGEIRLTHTMDIIRDVIASGTRSVTVTLTDPKVFGEPALDAALDDLTAYDQHIAAHSDLLLKATSVADIDRARAESRLALFYMLQNTTPLRKDPDRVDMFYSLGLRALQLTYNYQNYAGSGCRELGDNGLTVYGHELIERMNEIGMLVDTSHANMRTMTEAITASKAPTIISHTTCRALHPHVRSTTDENLKLLADHGGVVGLTQIRPFLTDDRSDDNVRYYFDHIDHAINVAGEDHVCIGSDRDHRVIEDSEEELQVLLEEEGSQFNPADWPLYMPALNGPRRMEVVRDGLLDRYPAATVEKILWDNLYCLYAEVIG